MDINELKAQVYDLFMQRGAIMAALQEMDTRINGLQQEIAAKEATEPSGNIERSTQPDD